MKSLRKLVSLVPRFQCWNIADGEQAAGHAATLHSIAGQQGKANQPAVGIAGCGCSEGLMGSVMIGP